MTMAFTNGKSGPSWGLAVTIRGVKPVSGIPPLLDLIQQSVADPEGGGGDVAPPNFF
jgi:hypothetical protein